MPASVPTWEEFSALAARVTALERPTPVPTTTTPAPTPAPRPQALLGGWRLAQEYARGGLAIDFATMRAWLVGHAQGNSVVEFQLPAMGTGTNPLAWPVVAGAVSSGWWPEGYSNGLCWWHDKLWAAPKSGYDTSPPPVTTLYARDGQAFTLPLPRQQFAGFVKRGYGQDPYFGCGGYESGQGTSSGPTLARPDGTVLVRYGWPALPGAALEHWDERCPREPNYWPVGHIDNWVAWEPRKANNVLQGRWASDRIYGGGLFLPAGVTYWPWLGTGELNYGNQTATFAPDALNRTYKYTYDPTSYALKGWELGDAYPVQGQELSPDGKVYLCKGNVWASGLYPACPAVFVYG